MFTVGHGTLSAEKFAALVRQAGIAQIVDVRAFPASRRHPHFTREELARWLPELAEVEYAWNGELGGFRPRHGESRNVALDNPSFRAYADYMETDAFGHALGDLLARGALRATAMMCSESLWWRCHRRLIADAAVLLHAVDVAHLGHNGKRSPHVLTRGVRALPDGGLRYDVVDTSA